MLERRRQGIRKLKKYKQTRFKATDSVYDKPPPTMPWLLSKPSPIPKAPGSGKPFDLIDWQEQIIRDVFGTLKPNGYRQFNTAYVEIPKKMGKSELAAAIALCSPVATMRNAPRSTAAPLTEIRHPIVFNVAADMVRMCFRALQACQNTGCNQKAHLSADREHLSGAVRRCSATSTVSTPSWCGV